VVKIMAYSASSSVGVQSADFPQVNEYPISMPGVGPKKRSERYQTAIRLIANYLAGIAQKSGSSYSKTSGVKKVQKDWDGAKPDFSIDVLADGESPEKLFTVRTQIPNDNLLIVAHNIPLELTELNGATEIVRGVLDGKQPI
jgi:hypothetical protein